jgi:hypothetical protein
VILDSRTVQSTPESGARAGFDGHKKRKGSKVHIAVDTLGHLLAQPQAIAGMLLSPKPRPYPKILAPCGYSFSSNALKIMVAVVTSPFRHPPFTGADDEK